MEEKDKEGQPTQPNPQRNSIRCPKCYCRDCRVTLTRKIEITFRNTLITAIRRRRVCRYCGNAFYTVESYDDTSEQLTPPEGPKNPFV